jgi:hypothetical protein
MELIMMKTDKETSFGDQGHVFTAPRRLSCSSSSAYHLFRKEAPVGGVATAFLELMLLFMILASGLHKAKRRQGQLRTHQTRATTRQDSNEASQARCRGSEETFLSVHRHASILAHNQRTVEEEEDLWYHWTNDAVTIRNHQRQSWWYKLTTCRKKKKSVDFAATVKIMPIPIFHEYNDINDEDDDHMLEFYCPSILAEWQIMETSPPSTPSLPSLTSTVMPSIQPIDEVDDEAAFISECCETGMPEPEDSVFLSTPVTPPPSAPMTESTSSIPQTDVSPAGDWIGDYRLGGAHVRRSDRIASRQPPRRSPRLAALPRLNYRLM